MNKSKKQIIEENNKFDLEKFYRSKKQLGAVIVITPIQTIYNYSAQRHNEDIEDIFFKIYKSIRSELKESMTPYNREENMKKFGNIIIKLLNDTESRIYIPNKITEFQYNELKSFCDWIKYIQGYRIIDGEIKKLDEFHTKGMYFEVEFMGVKFNNPPLEVDDILKFIGSDNIISDENYKNSTENLLSARKR